MKKIISCVLVVIFLAAICMTETNAESFEDELSNAFFEYCGGNNSDWDTTWGLMYDTKVIIYEYTKENDVVYFSAKACWIASGAMEWIETFGDWRIYSPLVNYPSELSLYVKIGDEIYTIEDAWEKGLVTDLTPVEGFSKYTVVTRIDETLPTEPTATPTAETQATEPTTEPLTTEPISTQPVVKPAKKANPMKVTVKAKTVKYSKVKKAKQTVAPITVKSAQGKVTYKKLSGSKKLLLKSNGKIAVKKGAKKGTYTARIKITANGNSKYKAGIKTVTVKIKVK